MEDGLIWKAINHPSAPLSLVFEDDGDVAYAYLCRNPDAKICADVWVYNRSETSDKSEWQNHEGLPFRNADNFVTPRQFPLPERGDDIGVTWTKAADGRIGAIVLVHESPVAEPYVGDMPGFALLARQDGPCARVMKKSA